MGNCGFGIAPTRPEHRGVIARTLENVEGMSVEALDGRHPLVVRDVPRVPRRARRHAQATERRRHDRAHAVAPLRDGRRRHRAGRHRRRDRRACATSSARRSTPARSASPRRSRRRIRATSGKPVPSRSAETDEVIRIAAGDGGRGAAASCRPRSGPGFLREGARGAVEGDRPPGDVDRAAHRPVRRSGKTVELTLDKQAALGGEVWPQIACRPLVFQITLEDPFPFAMAPAFDEMLAAPARSSAPTSTRIPAWRERARPEARSRVGPHAGARTRIDETERTSALRHGPAARRDRRGARAASRSTR